MPRRGILFCLIHSHFLKKQLTNANGCDTMNLHSVLLCPFVPILIYKCIIAQNVTPVKKEIFENSNCSGRIKL